MEGIPGQ